jgi:hypothetical protein
MVEQSPLRHDLVTGNGNGVLKRKLHKKIRDRVKVCGVKKCWELKDGMTADLSLSRHYFDNTKYGKHITMRNVLFQLTFHELPPFDRIIRMKCENSRCVNPAHYSAAGWRMPFDDMAMLIFEREWIGEEEAIEMHAGKVYSSWYLRQMEAPAVGRHATFNAEDSEA